MENKNEFIMKRIKLGYSPKEAEAEWVEFQRIEKLSMSELKAEMTENEKKALKSATKGAKADKPKREYKPREKDKEKIEIIAHLAEYFAQTGISATIINEQKEISFKIGENDYSLSLIKHRKPKN